MRGIWLLLFLLLIIFGFLSACDHPKDNAALHGSGMSEKQMLDSLDHLDSLVLKFQNFNSEKAVAIARMAIRIPHVEQYPACLAKARIIMGTAFLDLQNDSSFYYFNSALNTCNANKQVDLKETILYSLAKIYVSSFDYKTALLYLDSVVNISSAKRNFKLLSTAFNEIGGIKADMHDYSNAVKMFDTAFKIAARHSFYTQMGVATGNLASFQEDAQKAIQMNKQALDYMKKSGSSDDAQAQLLVNIGNRFSEPDSSMKYYLSAIRVLDPKTSASTIFVAYNNLAYSYADKKEYKKAEECLTLNAIPLAEKSNDKDWLATLYDTYSDILTLESRHKEAALAEKKAFKYRENAYDFKVTGQIRLLSLQLDVKNKELDLKSKDQELQEKSDKIRLLIFVLIFLAVVSIFILFWIWQRNRILFERQRFSSAKKILDLEESLKGRLAMELHDMTGPIYTSMISRIEEVKIPDGPVRDELYTSLNTLAEKIRRISHEMAGGYSREISFEELVQGLCDEMQYRTNAQIHLFLDQNEKSFPDEKTQHVLRIIQELLTNGVKYVKEGDIRLSISIDFGNLNIIYHDNGSGFDVNTIPKGGLGLANIVERAKLLGGSAYLESEPQKGTHWRIRIPLK